MEALEQSMAVEIWKGEHHDIDKQRVSCIKKKEYVKLLYRLSKNKRI